MRIGIDASRFQHPSPTGVEVYSDEIIHGLLELAEKQKKHDVVLYTPSKLKDIPARLQKIVPGRRLWTQRFLSREMKTNPPDVLFVPSHVLPLRHPKKSVITIHDVAFREFPSAYSLFQYLYLHWSTRFAVKRAWRIVVPSRATARDLERLYACPPEKLVVIPHGFRPPSIRIPGKREIELLRYFHVPHKTPYIFFVGRLESKKNIARLLQAFARFRETHSEWRMVLGGGRGVGFREVLRALHKEKLLEHVLMPGYLTSEEKHVLFKNARIFAFPSLSEGFGFPILEAAAYGVPTLASHIHALLEFKDYVDIFVDPKNIESIANGLEALAKQKNLLSKPSVSRYAWPQAAKQTWKSLTES